jgi:hypothetical protein
VLDEGDVAALFGLEMAETADAEKPTTIAPMGPKRGKLPAAEAAPAVEKKPARKKAAKMKAAKRKVTKDRGVGGKIAVRDGAQRRAS